jgi:dihydrofolate reductase
VGMTHTSRLRFYISLSLDGYVAGPGQSMANPLGERGARLHDWAFELSAFREYLGFEGGIENESSPVFTEWVHNMGASIMGRNLFGGHPGPWNELKPWTGWWGRNPPFHHPVFVLTHHAREPLQMEEGTVFHFVTGGPAAALEQARQAAAGKDVLLLGGAQTAQQYLRDGLVDEMQVSLVPILLGSGERLFEGVGDDLHGLRHVRTIAAPKAVHLKFIRP